MGKEDIRTEMSANMSTNMSTPASRKPERMWVTITKNGIWNYCYSNRTIFDCDWKSKRSMMRRSLPFGTVFSADADRMAQKDRHSENIRGGGLLFFVFRPQISLDFLAEGGFLATFGTIVRQTRSVPTLGKSTRTRRVGK